MVMITLNWNQLVLIQFVVKKKLHFFTLETGATCIDGDCVCDNNCENEAPEPLCANGTYKITQLINTHTHTLWHVKERVTSETMDHSLMWLMIVLSIDGTTYIHECDMNRKACTTKKELIA